MKIQKFKENYDTHIMYEIEFSKDVLFVEEQKDKTKDEILLKFQLNQGEKAYFVYDSRIKYGRVTKHK